MKYIEDREVIKRVKNGDREAFGLLVERYGDKVFTYFLKLIGDKEEAEDLTSEVFLKAFKKIGSFKDGKDFLPWLLRIARNEGINYMSRNKKLTNLNLDASSINAEFERDLVLYEALLSIPSKDRDIILLFYTENLSYKEISEVLGIPVSLVKVRLHRAKKKLKEALEVRNEG